MLDSNNTRRLCYLVKVDDIKPIEGRDRVECAVVGGWTVMVRKGIFKPGDLGIYFEIDSQTPAKTPFEFLETKHYKIKTQKYKTPSGQFWSQGLLMHPDDFGWESYIDGDGTQYVHFDGQSHSMNDDSRFLDKELGVTYAVAEDNVRKANSVDKYKAMAQRYGKLFAHWPFRQLMRHNWGKKLLFIFFGKKKDTKRAWPSWVVKTDEERVQNEPWVLQVKSPWIVSEKIDGTSTTFTMRRKPHRKRKYDYYVCSRNVVFDKPDKPCFYNSNVYFEMSEKYHIENVLKDILDKNPQYEWVTLQGETYGDKIQQRDYSLANNEHKLACFNFITSTEGRWNSCKAANLMAEYNIPWVPIIKADYILPDTIDELMDYSTGISVIDGKPREGYVFRSQDGTQSFKCVSNSYLEQYHS